MEEQPLTPRQLQKRLVQTAEKARVAVAERNRTIRQAREASWSLREIGDAVGLSHAGVRRIIERGD